MTFLITSNLSWSITSNATWCIATPDHETGNGSFDAIFEENTSVSGRIATLTVTAAGLSPINVTVTQAGVAPILFVTPSNQDVTTAAGATTFNVMSNTNWTAASDQTWCTVTPSGTGDGTITASYEENAGMSPRIAAVTVNVTGLAPVVVTVTQEGLVGLVERTSRNLQVYPNPTGGEFFISTADRSLLNMEVEVMNITGSTVTKGNFSGKNSYLFDLTGRPGGNYFIRIITREGTFVKKVVVE